VDLGLWKKDQQIDVYQEVIGLYYQNKRRVCAKKEKSISVVKGRERGGTQVHNRTIKKRVYQALKVASNGTSIFCKEKGWKEAYDIGL